MTDLKMSEPQGNCPVQAYGTIDGWLLYFRARGEWALNAWKPGNWDATLDAEAAVDVLVADPGPRFLNPDWQAYGDGGFEAEDFPMGTAEHYPGWWEPEYAKKVIAWAVERLPRGE